MLKLAMGMALTLAGGQATAGVAADTGKAYLPGIWSLGDTQNCSAGGAWVFLADGYYAEVTLPDKWLSATGLWRDEDNAIAYTHSHIPFPDMLAANELKRLTVVERSADKLMTKNYRGVPRVFHRCPAGSLKAPAGQVTH